MALLQTCIYARITHTLRLAYAAHQVRRLMTGVLSAKESSRIFGRKYHLPFQQIKAAAYLIQSSLNVLPVTLFRVISAAPDGLIHVYKPAEMTGGIKRATQRARTSGRSRNSDSSVQQLWARVTFAAIVTDPDDTILIIFLPDRTVSSRERRTQCQRHLIILYLSLDRGTHRKRWQISIPLSSHKKPQ